MEHSLRLIISLATNPTLVTLKKLKSYQASFLTTMLYDWKSTRKKLQKTQTRGDSTTCYQWITEEIKEEIKKYLEANDNEDTTLQNLWDTAKAILREKFIAIQAHLRKQEKAQMYKQPNLIAKAARERRTGNT